VDRRNGPRGDPASAYVPGTARQHAAVDRSTSRADPACRDAAECDSRWPPPDASNAAIHQVRPALGIAQHVRVLGRERVQRRRAGGGHELGTTPGQSAVERRRRGHRTRGCPHAIFQEEPTPRPRREHSVAYWRFHVLAQTRTGVPGTAAGLDAARKPSSRWVGGMRTSTTETSAVPDKVTNDGPSPTWPHTPPGIDDQTGPNPSRMRGRVLGLRPETVWTSASMDAPTVRPRSRARERLPRGRGGRGEVLIQALVSSDLGDPLGDPCVAPCRAAWRQGRAYEVSSTGRVAYPPRQQGTSLCQVEPDQCLDQDLPAAARPRGSLSRAGPWRTGWCIIDAWTSNRSGS